MRAVDLVASAFLALPIGWIVFMLWSTYEWLREGFEESARRGGRPAYGGGDW